MSGDPTRPSDVAEQTQRQAERSALRKVRATLDQLVAADGRQRRILRRALLFCAVLLIVGFGFVATVIFSGKPARTPVELPSNIPQRR